MSCLMFDDEAVAGLIPERESVSVTADGTKTYAQLFNSLFSLIDLSKVSANSKLVRSNPNILVWNINFCSSTNIQCSYASVVSNNPMIQNCTLSSSSKYEIISYGSYSDNSSGVPNSGIIFTFYY